MKNIRLIVASAAMLLFSQTATLTAQTPKTQAWFEAKEWLDNAVMKPAASLDVEKFAEHCAAHPNRWKVVFDYLANNDLEKLPLGLIELNENVKVNVQEYETRPVAKELLYEHHEQYIDVQCVVSGEELQGARKIEFGKVVKPYNAAKDIALYSADDVPFYLVKGGMFTVFFPEDIHTTNFGFAERTPVRKIVFKVKYH